MPSDRTLRSKTVAALAAATIHILAVTLFLMADRKPIALRTAEKFVSTWILPPLPEPVRPPQIRTAPLPSITLPAITLPPNENAPFALTPVQPFAPGAAGDAYVLGAIGNYFSCSMASYDKLSPEEKARCAPQLAQQDLAMPYVLTPYERQLQVVFAREFARKKAPLLLPCMPGGTDPKNSFWAIRPPADPQHRLLTMGPYDNGLEGNETLGTITIGQIICLVNGAIDGFDPDTSVTYAVYPYDSDVGTPTH